jgi:hypothetical protein
MFVTGERLKTPVCPVITGAQLVMKTAMQIINIPINSFFMSNLRLNYYQYSMNKARRSWFLPVQRDLFYQSVYDKTDQHCTVCDRQQRANNNDHGK